MIFPALFYLIKKSLCSTVECQWKYGRAFSASFLFPEPSWAARLSGWLRRHRQGSRGQCLCVSECFSWKKLADFSVLGLFCTALWRPTKSRCNVTTKNYTKKGQVHPKICTFSLLPFSAPVYHGEHIILKGRLAKLSGSLFFFFPF